MAEMKIRIGGEWVTISGGAGSGGGDGGTGGTDYDYIDQLREDMEGELADLTEALGNTDDYIDNAFRDGIITEVEAKKIKAYLNTLATEKSQFDAKYTEIYNNTYLSASRKTSLSNVKNDTDTKYSTLVTTITNAIADSKSTTEEADAVDLAFASYGNSLSLLASTLEIALDEISKAKADEAKQGAIDYTDELVNPLAERVTTTESSITKMDDEIKLRVTSETYLAGLSDSEDAMKKYTDDQKKLVDADIEALEGTVAATNTYIDGAFKDGIIYDAEMTQIKGYLNTLAGAKAEFDKRYETVHTNEDLPATPKTNLESAKTSYDNTYTILVQTINDAIADQLATGEETTAVDNAFTNYNNAISVLATALEVAIDEIGKKKAADAEANAKDYADGLKETLESSIEGLEESIQSTDDYVDGAFKDGIVTEMEAKKIQASLNNLASAKAQLDQRYAEIYVNEWLDGVPKINLYQKKQDADDSYDALVGKINSTIVDGIATSTESAEVDLAFYDYNNDVSALVSALEQAIDYISMAKATAAEVGAKKYSDDNLQPIETRIETAESTITQHAKDIALRVTTETYNVGMSGVDSRIESAEGLIKVNSDNIALRVTKTEYNNDSARVDWYYTVKTQSVNLIGDLESQTPPTGYTWEITTLPDGSQGRALRKLHIGGNAVSNTGWVMPKIKVDPKKTYLMEFYVKPMDTNSKYYYGREEYTSTDANNDAGTGPYIIAGASVPQDVTGQWKKHYALIPPYDAGTTASHTTVQSDFTPDTEYKFWDANSVKISPKVYLTYGVTNTAINSEMYAWGFGLYEVGSVGNLYESYETAQAIANSAQDAADAAKKAADQAQEDADKANTEIADISSDNKITPGEKTALKKDWDAVYAEKPTIVSQATTYGITTEKTNYTNAYDALNTFVTPLVADLSTTNDVVGSDLRTKFSNYYDTKAKLLQKITDIAKQKADDAQASANASITAGTLTNNPLFLNWTGSIPTGTTLYGTTPSATITMDSINYKTGGKALKMAPTGTEDCGLSLASFFLSNIANQQYYVVEMDLMLLSGTFSGAGLMLDWNGMATNRVLVDFTTQLSATVSNKWYSIKMMVERPTGATGTFTGLSGFLMANSSTFGGKVAKSFVVDRLVVREASKQEITSYIDTGRISTLETWKTSAEQLITSDAIVSTVRQSTQYLNDLGEKVSSSEIISQINQTAEAIQIMASKIDLLGAVSFSSLDSGVQEAITTEGETINTNPYFLNWPSTQTLPTGYGSSTLTTSASTVSKLTESGQKGNTLRFVVASGDNAYLTGTKVTNAPYYQYVTLVCTFRLEAGAIDGAGVLVRYNATANTDNRIHFKDIIPTPSMNKWYTITKVIKMSSATEVAGFSGYTVYPMGGYSNFGTISAKTISFNQLVLRPSTEQEINSYTTKLSVDDILSDLKVTTVEKNQLSRDWEAIKAEYTQLDALATSLGVSKTTYASAYSDLDGKTPKIATEVLASMTTTYSFASSTTRDDFKNKLTTYYTEAQKIRKAMSDQIQTNVNNIKIGAANMLPNSTWNYDSTGWEGSWSSTYVLTDPESDKPSSHILKIVSSATTSQKSNVPIQITAGETYTVSFDVKMDKTWNSSNALFIARAFTDSSITNSEANSSWSQTLFRFSDLTVVNKWVRVSVVITPTSGGWLRAIPYNGSFNYDSANGKITTYFRELKVEKGNRATDWTPAQVDVDNAVTKAQTDANTANASISDMSSDNKLAPTEKILTKKDWDAIVGEKPIIDGQADIYGVTTEKTAYGTAYTALNTYITPLLADLTKTSDITGSDFRSKFSAYYNAKTTLLKAVANASKLYTDAIEIGGRNIILNSDFSKGLTGWYDWGVGLGTKTLVDVTDLSNFKKGLKMTYTTVDTSNTGYYTTNVAVEKDGTYTLSAWVKPVSGIFSFQEGNATVNYRFYTFTATDLIYNKWQRVSWTFQAKDSNLNFYIGTVDGNMDCTFTGVQLEKGNKRTDWSPAPEDVQAQLDDIASDSKLTASEKQIVKKDWDVIVAEKPTLDSAATTYGVTTEKTNYGTVYTALNTYITPLLADLSTTSDIVGTTFRTKFSDYYDKKALLQKAITDASKDYTDNLEIGGSNIYPDSYLKRVTVYNSAYGTVTSTASSPTNQIRVDWVTGATSTSFGFVSASADRRVQLISGQTYTLSFEVRGNVANIDYTYFMRNSAEGSNSIFPSIPVSLDAANWTKVTVTRTSPWTTSTGYILIGSKDGATGKWFEVRKAKLEQGDKATDWSANIDDVNAQIETKSKTFTTTPTTPYAVGDIWKNGTAVYICTVARTTGNYTASDWALAGDVTGSNTAYDTAHVNGTDASVVSSAITNFNANNDRKSTTPATPTGVTITSVTNTDSSADITFSWTFTGSTDAYDIDGFIVEVYSASASTAYTIVDSSSKQQEFVCGPTNRGIIIQGVPCDKYYTIGVRAYRVVDTDINSAGIIKGAFAQNSTAHRPAATPNFTGNVGGTDAGTVASNSQTAYDTVTGWKVSGKTTIDGGMIETNTIKAVKIAVGDFTNLATANEMTGATTTSYAGGEAIIDSTGYVKKKLSTQTYLMLCDHTPNIFKANDELLYEFTGKTASTTKTATLTIWCYDANKAFVASHSSSITLTATDAKYTGTIKITNTGFDSAVYFLVGFSGASNDLYVKQAVFRKKVTGELIVDGTLSFDKAQGGALKLGQQYGDGHLEVWADADGDGTQEIIGIIDQSSVFFPEMKSDSFVGNVVNTWMGGTSNKTYYFDTTSGSDSNDGSTWANAKQDVQGFISSLPKNLNGGSITIYFKNNITGGLNISGFHGGDILLSGDTSTTRYKIFGTVAFQNCFGGKFLAQGYDSIYDSAASDVAQNSANHCSFVSFYSVKVYGGNLATHGFWFEDSFFELGECHVYNIKDRGLNAGIHSRGQVTNCRGVAPIAMYVSGGSWVNGAGARWDGPIWRGTGGMTGSILAPNSTATPPTAWTNDVWVIDRAEAATTAPATPPAPAKKSISIAASSGDNYSTSGYWTNNEVKQGDYGYGNRFGIWYFDFSAIAGKTIDSATITIYRKTGAGISGVEPVNLRAHKIASRATRPSSLSSANYTTTSGVTVNMATGQTVSTSITALLQYIVTNSATYKGIGVYSGGSDYVSLGTTPTIAITYH